jgi:hypothetical protein
LCFSERALLSPFEFHAMSGDSEIRVSQWSRTVNTQTVHVTPETPAANEAKIEAVKSLPTRNFIFRSPIKGTIIR